jgi:hypothetical protein
MNPVMHTKTKHFDIKYHYLRELLQEKELIANIFTKALAKDAFEYVRGKLGVILLPEENSKDRLDCINS